MTTSSPITSANLRSRPWLDVKFGAQGEWAESRVLQVQFQHIKGTDLGQFKDLSTQVVITPAQYKSGEIIYPYEKAK
jgi:branched-chain amino acid transport system substrate-binding protein